MAARNTQDNEQHIRFQSCPNQRPSMASEETKKPLDGAAVEHITEIVKNVLRTAQSEDVESSVRRSHHALAPTRGSTFSSNVIYTAKKPATILSPEWYKELRPHPIRSGFSYPRELRMPDFFRISDALHNSMYACNSITDDSRSEADALYQIQAFIHDNLNRQLSVIDEFCAVDVSKLVVDVLEDNWGHLYGISEMIQARYDILCGRRVGDREQTRLLDLCTRPPVGTGALARSINRNLRQLWTSDAPNDGPDSMRETTDSEDFTRDGDNDSYTRDRDRSQIQLTRDRFGPASTWDRVAQIENKETGGGVKVNECSFVYVMRSHDLVKERAVYSPWYSFGGYRWRLLLFPQADRHFDDLMNVYLVCGGPGEVRKSEDDIRPVDGAKALQEQEERMDWFCAAEFSLRLLHPSSPIAKEAFRRDMGDFQDPTGLQESSTEGESSGKPYPDLVEEYYHVFRANSDDWGGGVAPFSMLQPGKYADKDMNLAFLASIRLES